MILKKGSRGTDVKDIQRFLTHLGYDTNGVDGDFGEGTYGAVKGYQGDNNLSSDGIVGTVTGASLIQDYYSSTIGEDISWMTEAFKDYLQSEIKGKDHNPAILQLWKDAYLGGIKDDETPYCAGAVSAWLERAGVLSQRTAWARNYLNQGSKILEPRFGAVVVFSRGNGGHVGFVTGVSEDGSQVRVLGANQSDCVNERMFDTSRVLGYRNPVEGYPLPPAPIVGKGEVSKNEA